MSGTDRAHSNFIGIILFENDHFLALYGLLFEWSFLIFVQINRNLIDRYIFSKAVLHPVSHSKHA